MFTTSPHQSSAPSFSSRQSGWEGYNRRRKVLREVLAAADRTGNGANNAFAIDVEVLLDIQMSWFQRLSGQMDRTLSVEAEDRETRTINAWAEAAAQMPGARAILDAHHDVPELETAIAKEFEFLVRSAGVSCDRRDLIGHGQRIKDAARAEVAHVPVAA